MKPPRKKQKRNITGLRNQPKTVPAMTETVNKASKHPSGDLGSTTFSSAEPINEENPDEGRKPHVHFDSTKMCWDSGDEESDEDEDKDLDDLMDICNEQVYSRMVSMAIMLGDDPQDVD
ncbi:hypothetical protein C0992_008244 [Termitomyces sp. T32_za158]|nr:hypothetical protein C0992_008244 [Termitomyces sp. T32_za158]